MKRIWFVIVVLVVALAGFIVWQAVKPGEPEPVYDGKTLTSWLALYAAQEGKLISYGGDGSWGVLTVPGADEAVEHLGTNAIPTLLRLLRTKDSPFKVKLLALTRRQHLFAVNAYSDHAWHHAAWVAFMRLYSRARFAAPSLIELADHNISPSSQDYALKSLDVIGRPPESTVPALLQWATNADPRRRSFALEWLPRLDPAAAAKAGITNKP